MIAKTIEQRADNDEDNGIYYSTTTTTYLIAGSPVFTGIIAGILFVTLYVSCLLVCLKGLDLAGVISI